MPSLIEPEVASRHPRRTPRFKIFQPALIDGDHGPRRAHILDLSTGGARLHCREVPPLGAWLALSCAEFTMRGRIVWRREARFGLEFQRPLLDRHVRRIIERATPGA